MTTGCIRLWKIQATIAAVFSATLLLSPPASWAQSNPADEAQGNPPSEVKSPQEDDGVDSNLVPLEPELDPALTVSPPDLPSADGTGEPPEEIPDKASPDIRGTMSAEAQGPLYNIPVVIDQAVESHIHFFNTSIRNRFEQWLLRFGRYRPLVETIFAEFDLPSDLVNLSLVESGFNPYAYSRAKATGPWQFMKGTGQLYGLRIDYYVDERRDPIKSTVAAARYLRDLYDLFGAWPLAMAAYNAGEGKVLRALQKAQAESFSEISQTKLIRLETKQYVPRIMAATIIAKNLDQYGFNQDPVPLHQFEEVVVTRPLHFRAIANVTGIPYAELRLLNPELRRDATPPYDSAYHLKVPVGTSAKVIKLIDRVPTYKFPPLRVGSQRVKTDTAKFPSLQVGSQRVKTDTVRWYRVRMGDTLEKVSRRFHIPLKTLKALNHLSSPMIRAGELLVITR